MTFHMYTSAQGIAFSETVVVRPQGGDSLLEFFPLEDQSPLPVYVGTAPGNPDRAARTPPAKTVPARGRSDIVFRPFEPTIYLTLNVISPAYQPLSHLSRMFMEELIAALEILSR